MYKLLLVSDKPEICALYRRYSAWETLGFERPAVAASAEEGISVLAKGRFDAVSCLLSISEGKRFFAYLRKRPEMLGMETARDEAQLRREISTARRLLSSRDAGRQAKQVNDMTRALQEEFFSDLLRGTGYDAVKIDERMESFVQRELDATRPVAMASFRLPQGDYFLSEVWRYGRDRLENALKNIFENGDGRLDFVVLIINPHHMRLIGLPREDMTREQVHALMEQHLAVCEANMEQYFELTLDVKRIVSYDNLYALGKENTVRTAH